MGVEPSDAKAVKLVAVNEVEHLFVGRLDGLGQRGEVGENLGASVEVAASQLSDDERMGCSPPSLQ